MAGSFARAVRTLCALTHRFDAEGHAAKQAALQRASALPLAATPTLARYHDALLFLCAHAADAAQWALVKREFSRIARCLKASRGQHPPALENQGLPFVDTVTRFSHDCARWLLTHPQARVGLDRSEVGPDALNEVLGLTLPPLERHLTTAGLDLEGLMAALRVPAARRLSFLVDELAQFDDQPFLKDRLFDRLDLWLRVSPRGGALSKAGNRLPMAEPFFARETMRRFDVHALLSRRLPAARRLDEAARAQVVQVLKNTMLLTARETDPCTYLDERSLRVFDLERGLSVAVFGMRPARQLPLESYIGFTLFRNGLAVAYGGAWPLGSRADFGMNIFEPYRGGESGYMMCQVLRVYRQLFELRLIEVDAHQFGLDNPDGIASGAYWFYHRHGFRSIDPALARRAERECERMAADPRHRSSPSTLRAFTGSNMALDFGGPATPAWSDLAERVTHHIQRRHGGDRGAAERSAVQRFTQVLGRHLRLDAQGLRVQADLALLADALGLSDAANAPLLARLVRAKRQDPLHYQRLLRAWLQQARI